jgi:hypothetical protein
MNIRKPATATAVIGLSAALFAAAATADPLPRAATVQAGRCTAVIRATVRDERTTLIRHTITGVRTVGARREFTIESAVYGPARPEGRSFVSLCRAERWGEGAELSWVRPVLAGTGPVAQMVAR